MAKDKKYGEPIGYAGGGKAKACKKPKKKKMRGTGAATKGLKFSVGNYS